jgi:hypothetical protein
VKCQSGAENRERGGAEARNEITGFAGDQVRGMPQRTMFARDLDKVSAVAHGNVQQLRESVGAARYHHQPTSRRVLIVQRDEALHAHATRLLARIF